jgi:REP element-mobilizing transposase RayT
MARGNERRAIYRDDEDRHRFLETMGEMAERFAVLVHSYCLMPNHYHLIVETPRGNLSQAVGWLQVTYTVRFNHRHRRSGHLFQGRFKAQLVEADAYAQWLVEYVHLNPVRPLRKGEPIAPERAAELDRYAWSSHRDYAGLRTKAARGLCLEWRRYWGANASQARQEYRRRIAQAFARGLVKSPWEKLRGGLVLGGERLWEQARALVGHKRGREEAVWSRRGDQAQRRRRLESLLAKQADEQVRIWALVRLGGQRQATLARALGYRDGSGIAYVVRRVEQKARTDRQLADKLEQLKDHIYSLQS